MGCFQSKEAGAAASKSVRFQLVEKIESMAAQITKGNAKRAHHLRNIFVAPLEDLGGYKPPSYPKSEKDDALIRKALHENFVFATLEGKDLDTMVGAFEEHAVPKDENIITQGDVGDYFYVLKSGTVRFVVSGKNVGNAKKGDSFGELALLYSAPRAASVIAESACQVFRVDQKTFRKILQSSGQKAGSTRHELARKVEIFKDLDQTDINKIAKIMKPRPFKEGEYLCHKGEEGEGIYIVQVGELKATNLEAGGKTYADITAGPGENLGAIAIAQDGPMPGDIVGVKSGVVFVIEKKVFRITMGDYKRLASKMLDKRILGAVDVLSKTSLDSIELATLADMIVEKPFFKDEVIVQRGKANDAALYLVREGSVKIHQVGHKDKIIGKNGYFGEDQLTIDVKTNGEGDPVVHPKYSVTALENCKLGILTLADCRSVFDTTTIGQGKKVGLAAYEAKIEMKDVTKHKILGAGTFGQVWLVSTEDKSGVKHPYALKIQIKYDLIENGQAQGVVREKNVMAQLKHPFCMKLVKTFQDPERIYMLTGLLQGGELQHVFYEREYRDGLPEAKAKFYMAGTVEGLSYMHSRHIIHRDLKPENVMINSKGYPVLIDFGFAKYVPDKTYTFCGTPLYIAPEVLLNRGHDRGADHWSLGCIIYESMTGDSPFYDDKAGMDQLTLFKAIVKGDFDFPRKPMSNEAKTMICDFLEVEPSNRLGSLAGGLKDIYRHPWFHDIDFRKIRKQEYTAPWVPEIKNPLDNSNFADWSKQKDKDAVKSPKLSPKEQAMFKDF